MQALILPLLKSLMAKKISQVTVKAQADVPRDLWRRAKAKATLLGQDSSAMMIAALTLYLRVEQQQEDAA